MRRNNFSFLKWLTVSFCWIMIGCQTTQGTVPNAGIRGQKDHLQGPGKVLAEGISFAAETGEIRYTLPEPALVRIRIGIQQGGPLLRTLVDWEWRDRGEHRATWDRKDPSGKIDFGHREDYLLVLSAVAAPRDTGLARGLRKAPEFTVVFPESSHLTEEGIPVVEHLDPARVILAEEDKQWLTETKYEMAFYLDHLYLMEDEVGTSPFNYQLSTEGVNEGLHFITVNVISYEGEVGTKSELIYVKNN